MKKVRLIALATMFAAGAASAQDTTVVRKEGDLGGGSKTVIKHDDDAKVFKKVRVDRNAGCATKTVKTNEMGESVKKTKSSC